MENVGAWEVKAGHGKTGEHDDQKGSMETGKESMGNGRESWETEENHGKWKRIMGNGRESWETEGNHGERKGSWRKGRIQAQL
jgi:hypothetical protein